MAGHMGNKNCTKTVVKVIIFLPLLFLFLFFSKRMILWNLDNLERPGDWQHRGILVYTICLISVRNSVSDGTTNISLLNIERSQYD